MDVAGGAGHLSVMLACYDGIPCTVIDPRHSDFASLAIYLSTRRRRSVIRTHISKLASFLAESSLFFFSFLTTSPSFPCTPLCLSCFPEKQPGEWRLQLYPKPYFCSKNRPLENFFWARLLGEGRFWADSFSSSENCRRKLETRLWIYERAS